MAYPVPVATCEAEGCGVRFVLSPDALLEEEADGTVEILCPECWKRASWSQGSYGGQESAFEP